ncbi:S8/S53 family peptidase [Polyangium sp. y55x31]|uniref:S8 family peptidase n=1 Tax=Polyangium sp. y55x31 TaxID=3042688 RepID=UPI002482E39F|nr:S8/S53 family peptidase [Polyangium sp. y55x31]MDI1479351.1 S8/S53 family peptidase [Polyangium sp. y55x31]
MSRSVVAWAPFEVHASRNKGAPRILASFTSSRGLESDHLVALGVPGLWKKTRGEGVRVALLDSGVARVSGLLGADALYLDHDGNHVGPGDRAGHGTACASLIASRDKRAPGVAPEATLVSIRVADLDGNPEEDRVIAGLETALRLECDVVSCSFVFRSAWQAMFDAVGKVLDKGLVVVAASGNDPSVSNAFPEKTPGVVVVGALDADGEPLSEQRLGRFTDVFAPGEELLHIDAGGDASTRFGHTSGATALTSGVVALILSTRTGPSRRQAAARIPEVLRRTARRVHGAGSIDAGLVDAPAAISGI